MRRSLSFKFPYSQKSTPPTPSGRPRVVLITGASSGVGKSLAEKLLKKGGSTVYCTARDVPAMESLGNEGAKVHRMDVTDNDSVTEVVETVIKEQGQIDVLVCNAGYGCFGAIEAVDIDAIHHQFDVNLYGIARCLRQVLPHMRAQRAGRIVLMSSVVGHISLSGIGWYAASKHAIQAMAVALRQEVRPFGIDVVLIEPSAVKTKFEQTAFDQLEALDAPEDYFEFHKNVKKYFRQLFKSAAGPDATATQMVAAVCDKKPKRVYKTGRDSKVMPFVASFASDGMYDSYCKSMLVRAAAAEEEEPGSTEDSVQTPPSTSQTVPAAATDWATAIDDTMDSASLPDSSPVPRLETVDSTSKAEPASPKGEPDSETSKPTNDANKPAAEADMPTREEDKSTSEAQNFTGEADKPTNEAHNPSSEAKRPGEAAEEAAEVPSLDVVNLDPNFTLDPSATVDSTAQMSPSAPASASLQGSPPPNNVTAVSGQS